jgi:hypothetical protein
MMTVYGHLVTGALAERDANHPFSHKNQKKKNSQPNVFLLLLHEEPFRKKKEEDESEHTY